jgi:hypothetical protein
LGTGMPAGWERGCWKRGCKTLQAVVPFTHKQRMGLELVKVWFHQA